MATNRKLNQAKRAKKDEFYTQLQDIDREMQAYLEYNPEVFRDRVVMCPCDDPEWSNFTRYFSLHFSDFGLRKPICTSYAPSNIQPTLFETASPQYDAGKTHVKGKLFVLDRERYSKQRIDIDDLEWEYLEGDGDFRSEAVTRLRDEADFIITNPPFSLFREFLRWINEGEKGFSIVGNQNAVTYKEIFPLIMENKLWLGRGFEGNVGFFINKHYEDYAVASAHEAGRIRVSGVTWYTNIDHGRRHQPLVLMDMAGNRKHSRYSVIREQGYPSYDNYEAIEVAKSRAIPSDFKGVMGVPITFLYHYCPEQFEIIGVANHGKDSEYDLFEPRVAGETVFKRILIRFRPEQ